MTRRLYKFRFLFILFIGIASAIITTGSLINFHQYKIWGKPLIPEFLGYKRDQDKSIKIIQANKASFGSKILNDFSDDFPIFSKSEPVYFQFLPSTPLTHKPDFFPPLIFLSSSQGLRAPPLA